MFHSLCLHRALTTCVLYEVSKFGSLVACGGSSSVTSHCCYVKSQEPLSMERLQYYIHSWLLDQLHTCTCSYMYYTCTIQL